MGFECSEICCLRQGKCGQRCVFTTFAEADVNKNRIPRTRNMTGRCAGCKVEHAAVDAAIIILRVNSDIAC